MSDSAYPIILSKGKQAAYVVFIPDFEINTQGDSLAHAIDMAKDAVEMMGVCLQDNHEPIPAPSDIAKIKVSGSEIKTLVAVDFDEYRKKTETKTVRKNLTIPSWLNQEAEKAGINFSAVLQNALKEQLGLSH
jgi:predicted RNase H-like HicB family nuclease